MKRLIIGLVLGAALLLAVACGGGGTNSALEPFYQYCQTAATEERGHTDAYAVQFCTCYVDGLAEVYTFEQVSALSAKVRAGGADLTWLELEMMLEIADECDSAARG